MVTYKTWAQKLEQEFQTFNVEYAQRSENRFVDALTTLGSQVPFKGRGTLIRVSKQKYSIIGILKKMFPKELEKQNWRNEAKGKMEKSGHGGGIKELKDYNLIEGELYMGLP